METVEPHGCEKCGQSFSDSGLFTSHPCSERPITPSSKLKVGNYKCSQCSEVFSESGVLKRHFKITHSGHDPEGPFPCAEPGCQFSSADRQEYQAHLMSTHGLTLVPCHLRSCKVSFLTQDEMERHLRGHMPFGCIRCQFVTLNVEDLNDHLVEHNHQPPCAQENETAATVCTNGSNQPQASGRPKRKLIPKPVYASSLTEDGNEEPPEQQRRNIKRVRKAVERDKPSAVDAASAPSKEYLAEGSEHTYRTHTCPKCRRCFKMRSHLQEHLHLHFPDPSLQCPNCKRYFTSKSKLRIHSLREAGDKVHHCHLCEYSAVEQNAIRRHLASVHADEAEDGVSGHSYPCPTCGQSFLQSMSLKAHMKTHNILSGSKPVACFQGGCSFKSSLRKELLRHTAEVHGVRAVVCRHHACGAVFQSETDMEAHYRTHLAYHCSQCDFSCSNKTVFLQHRRHGHPGNDELCCDFCSFATFNPVEFEQHIGHLHANEKIHRCSQCSYVTSHKRGLKRHMLMHSGEKPHKCSLCEFRCRDESYLSKHMLTHSDDKNFMCAECGYVTKWKHYLNVHMRKHAGDLRYKCDQCPYRCHRMDQLNSHKLRHQAKSLMCEICAYACKRKYELRNHMLAKHSGEEKPPSVLKCKYCTYTTCYRQALQNHENCKHTKLKEFRCALCFYSSFSSISLFLHKRKAHGYVPGDKAWLENYAAKEKERNSTGFLQDFYKKPSAVHKQPEPSTSEGPPSSQREQSDLPGSADHVASKGSLAGSGTMDAFDVVSQEVVNEGVSDNPSPVNSPEEYCTLVLTTLSTTDYQTSSLQSQEGHCTNQTPSTANLNCNGFDISQEKADLSSSEEDNVAMADAEREQSDLDDNCVPRNNTSQPVEPRECRTSEVENDGGSIGSTFPSEQNKPLESEIRLKAMKKHDKDQADAMVLEGRVQMLVVPTKDVHRCDKCSYVTSKASALKYHCRALCRGRTKGHNTTRRYRLEEHESLHTGIGRHSCDVCGKTFGAVTKLRQHKMRIHDKRPTHFCPFCDFSGYTLDDVRRHNLRCHTGELQHACTHCEARFSSEVALRNHCKRAHQLQVRFSCKQCDYSCGSEASLKTHKESKHPQVKCNTCQESFKTKEGLEIHQRTHLAHLCQLCPFGTKTRQLLAQHLLSEHEEGSPEDKPFKCSSCQFACRHQLVLEQHFRSHGGKRLYKCTDCEYSTRNKQKITWHIRIHTGEKPYSCDQCSYTCTDPSRLKLHMRVHQEEKKYLCPDCGYKCKWATQLKYHMTKHTGDKPFACDECDYRTNRADALRAHRDTQHCDLRPYVCEKCGKAFKTSFILKTHQRQHSDDRPYSCGLCHKAFRWPAGLRHHYLSHTKQQPFCCRHCSYRAKQKFQVVKHLRRHHPEMSVEQGVVRDSEAVSLTLKEALQGTLDKRAAEVEEEEVEEEGTADEAQAGNEEVVQRETKR
ncbi:hypothetical protein VZT92_005480 [Zoarces viviparus]|uniref:C2H2-type domain-containing protein n=1 Tax=Zoarces viviparus TaxID=48416 RepID=A0AAW1FSM3_ZOAVI